MDAHNATRPTLRVIFAFLHGVALGIFWEGISMGVLVAATLVEHACGELAMVGVFWGAACAMYYISHRVDLLWPLLGILLFRLSAQLAMGVTTGSVLLTTLVAETPACTSDRIRDAAWRGPLLRILRPLLPRRALRRVLGVEPPFGPPFLRVLAAQLSSDWLGWVPSWVLFGLPSPLALPGTITFRPGTSPAAAQFLRRHPSYGAAPGFSRAELTGGWLPGAREVSGVYRYTCADARHGDFVYAFTYRALWMRPAAVALLRAFGSLALKLLLMHAYAALFMLLAQGNCRDAFYAELKRCFDRIKRKVVRRPPVKLIPVEAGDLCAFCHEELAKPPPDDDGHRPPADPQRPPYRHCRWGCGKAVHVACAEAWGRDACVYCSSAMWG